MHGDTSAKIHQINYYVAETDALYHQAAFKIGVADSVMRILYTLYDHGETCLLSDIYKQSGISKQTVNSAIRKLEKDNILYLEAYKARSKRVLLTAKGKDYLSLTAKRLYDAEIAAFEDWTEEEIDIHIRLMAKYTTSLQKQILFL